MWRNLRYSILAILVLAAIITPATDILNICLFLLPDGRALQNEHRSGLAGKSRARAQGKRSIVPSLQFRLMQEFGASATTRLRSTDRKREQSIRKLHCTRTKITRQPRQLSDNQFTREPYQHRAR